MSLKLIILLVISYLLGSIPNALWIGKVFKGIDIREHGSGNTGATNAGRVLGAKLGLLTLVLDILKGMIPVLIGIVLIKNNLLIVENNEYNNQLKLYSTYDSNFDLVLIGLLAIIGHSFSIFLKFKGGKAVATTLGVFLVLVPKAILVITIVFFLVFFIYRYVSLASIISATLLPIAILFIYHDLVYTLFGLFIGILIVIRHKSNLDRLYNGTEKKFTFKK